VDDEADPEADSVVDKPGRDGTGGFTAEDNRVVVVLKVVGLSRLGFRMAELGVELGVGSDTVNRVFSAVDGAPTGPEVSRFAG
jgi:hypothetical protein